MRREPAVSWSQLKWNTALVGEGMGEAVGVGAGFDDGSVERESVDDGGAEPGVTYPLGSSRFPYDHQRVEGWVTRSYLQVEMLWKIPTNH